MTLWLAAGQLELSLSGRILVLIGDPQARFPVDLLVER
jgi:hypothetical protein